jgi:hypothetical protein
MTSSDSDLEFLQIDVSEVGRYPDALHDMACKKTRVGLIVRNLFDRETMDHVAAQLTQAGMLSEIFLSPVAAMQGLTYRPPDLFGRPIVGAGDLSQYFTFARVFREKCQVLFGQPHFEERVQWVFSQLSGGRAVSVPTNALGETYSPATVRVLPDGHEIKLHVGNDFLRMKEAEHLNSLVDTHADQLSYFMPISVPESGGELIVYTRKWREDEPTHTLNYQLPDEFVEGVPSLPVAPRPGDLLMFNGGRYLHRVSMVHGPTPRRTIGGFMALTRDGQQDYFWS